MMKSKIRSLNPCSLDGCGRYQWSRGLCAAHYTKLKKSGLLATIKPQGTAIERFNGRYVVDPITNCWNWTGALQTKGYAVHVDEEGWPIRGSRFAYQNFVGEISPGLLVCHRCDNPKCVNPDHLFLGDHRANANDMVAKGRQGRRGRKLTPQMVNTIRMKVLRGELSRAKLAEIYSVDVLTISNIVNGQCHVTTPFTR